MFFTHCYQDRFEEARAIIQKITAFSPAIQPLFCAATDCSGLTPLHAAAWAQWPEAVELLLGLCPVVANWRTFAHGKPKGWTPLLVACDVGFPRPPPGQDNVDKQLTMLQLATLLARQMEPHALCAVTSSASNFLHVLASRGYEAVLGPLLAELEREDEHGHRPLPRAEVVALLNETNKGDHTVLDCAAQSHGSGVDLLEKEWPEAARHSTASGQRKGGGGKGGGGSFQNMQRRLQNPQRPPASNNAAGDERRWNRRGRR